ncbi:MAG: glycerol-3-phosphate 1-O-acyltransferase PlsY [Chloroflexi bacterium]|nr:glycerol-3-phosphate 1-O-acyltransferase PlsY [Chloroflexota bacterium]
MLDFGPRNRRPSGERDVNSLTSIVAAIGAYLIGSFPTGTLVARIYRNVDLTRVGSERTGATNTMRTLGLGAGAIVLAVDFGKGVLAVWIAQQLTGVPAAVALAGFVAVVGHSKSIFLLGRGGRGVVTGLGGLAFIATGVFVPAFLTGTVVTALTRYASLGSICGSAMTMLLGVLAYSTGHLLPEYLVYTTATPMYIIAAHADNIRRLLSGTERRMGEPEAGGDRGATVAEGQGIKRQPD